LSPRFSHGRGAAILILHRLCGEFVTVTVPACPGGCCPARTLRVGVNDVRGHNVVLAFDAPPEVIIMRDELLAPKPGVRR
jgi:hypothetical protein